MVKTRYMPITKAAKKSIRQTQRRKVRNLRQKRALRALLKQANVLIAEDKKEDAKKLLPQIYKALDKATKNNLLKKNTSSRAKSRLTIRMQKA